MKYLVFIAYYIFICFIIYGNYHIIFVLHESKWWLISLILIGIAPYSETKQ